MMNYLTTKLTIGKVDSQALVRGEELLTKWRQLTTAHDKSFETVTIALVGKYTNLHDSYLSVIKSLEHASMRCNRRLKSNGLNQPIWKKRKKKKIFQNTTRLGIMSVKLMVFGTWWIRISWY